MPSIQSCDTAGDSDPLKLRVKDVQLRVGRKWMFEKRSRQYSHCTTLVGELQMCRKKVACHIYRFAFASHYSVLINARKKLIVFADLPFAVTSVSHCDHGITGAILHCHFKAEASQRMDNAVAQVSIFSKEYRISSERKSPSDYVTRTGAPFSR